MEDINKLSAILQMEKQAFYRNLNQETFEKTNCFLCGFECDGSTEEHIFPKWIQHKYNLWDQKLEITNGTTIPYRSLTVPCCSKCNNEDLSKMETEFQSILNRSFVDLSMDDEIIIFQWTAKILYSTRYKELSLLVDRRNPDLGTILSPKELEGYTSLHLFLQSIRFKTTFTDPKPWSLFVLDCEDEDFFYHNNIVGLCLSMKFGKKAITIVYEENNLIEKYMHGFHEMKNVTLSFPQYLEVNCHIFYSAIIKENVPRYFSSFNTVSKELIVNTAGSLRSRNWVDEEYAHYFEFVLNSCGIELGESIIDEKGNIITYLIGENNTDLRKELFKEKADNKRR